MRLLHVVDTIDPESGGVSQAVRTMAAQIADRGLYNEILTLDAPAEQEEGIAYRINNIGPSNGRWSYSNALIPWLVSNLGRFDTIIVHGLWLYSGFAVTKALSIFKTIIKSEGQSQDLPSLYIMPHGMLDPYFQRSVKRRVKALRNWLYWKVIEGNVVNSSNGLLFTCRQECTLAREPFRPYRPKKELVVGLGVMNPPKFSYSMIDYFSKICPDVQYGKYILFLGRIDDKKGVDLLLQAYDKLLVLSEIGEVPQLVIAGPGMNSSYGLMLQNFMAEKPRLKDNVRFTGMLTGLDKWSALYGCEAFILPSHQENFGIAVVEALACGKPVLISNQVNINTEILQDQAAIIGEDTVEGTFDMLYRWISTDQTERDKMQERARICFQRHFAVEAATSNLINALIQVNQDI